MVPLYSSLGDRARLPLQKRKKKIILENIILRALENPYGNPQGSKDSIRRNGVTGDWVLQNKQLQKLQNYPVTEALSVELVVQARILSSRFSPAGSHHIQTSDVLGEFCIGHHLDGLVLTCMIKSSGENT